MSMTHDDSPVFIARLKRRYLIGLCSIALLSAGTFSLLEQALRGFSHDIVQLDRAAGQRIDSLRLLRAGEDLHLEATGQALIRSAAADQRATAQARWQRALASFRMDGVAHLDPLDDRQYDGEPDARAALDQRFLTLIGAADALMAAPESEDALARLHEEQQRFLMLMSTAATRAKERTTGAIVDQGRLIGALLVVTMTILLLEAIFVFEPALRSMRTQLQRLMGSNERMQWQACHDALTGLSNRCALVARLDELRNDAPAKRFTLYFIDFDGFKSINDTLGHEVGDRLLISIAGRLNELADQFASLPSAGTDEPDVLDCYRLGGDEFVLLAVGQGAHLNSDSLAHSLVASFDTAHRLDEHRCQSTASVGVFESDGSDMSVSRMMHNADLAMMRAKREGKGRHAFFDTRMRTAEYRRETIENDLFDAIETSEIGVRYQPIVCTTTGLTTGVEALMHWVHPELGPIDNNELVDVSSRIEGIQRLGLFVLDRSCRDIGSLERPICLHVNVHPIETRHPDHQSGVKECIERSGLSAERLHLECSAGLPTRGQAEYLTALRRLCSLGVQVGFDDVDREPMSLRALSDTPMSFVKLTPLPRPEVLDTFARLCAAVGLRTIATNVENEAMHAQVRAARFEAAQGYHLGRSMDITTLQQHLRDQHDDRRAA